MPRVQEDSGGRGFARFKKVAIAAKLTSEFMRGSVTVRSAHGSVLFCSQTPGRVRQRERETHTEIETETERDHAAGPAYAGALVWYNVENPSPRQFNSPVDFLWYTWVAGRFDRLDLILCY